MGQMKKESSFYHASGLDPYNAVKQQNDELNANPVCISPLSLIDAPKADCLSSCQGMSPIIGNLFFLGSSDTSCNAMYTNSAYAKIKCMMDCGYGGSTFVTDCVSTDGDNIYAKGTVSNGYGVSIEDSCAGTTIREYYCSNGYIKLKEESCSGGCNNGACINDGITYTSFISYKDSYVSGGDFSTFITKANGWIA